MATTGMPLQQLRLQEELVQGPFSGTDLPALQAFHFCRQEPAQHAVRHHELLPPPWHAFSLLFSRRNATYLNVLRL